jgi:Winged helix-turn helix
VCYHIRHGKSTDLVRTLTIAERSILTAGLRSHGAFVLRRCPILLASASGKRASQIAAALHCDTDTAFNAINAFNQVGLAALEVGSFVAKTIHRAFDAAAAEKLRALLHQSSRTLGKETSF